MLINIFSSERGRPFEIQRKHNANTHEHQSEGYNKINTLPVTHGAASCVFQRQKKKKNTFTSFSSAPEGESF